MIFIEPQIKEIVILEYTVNYINKINNKELIKIEFNNDLSKRLLIELKDLNQNTPYKICIEARLQFSCHHQNSKEDISSKFHSLLNEYCNQTMAKIVEQKIIINSCIDNITTQKSVSLQALTSSLGALISLVMIMTCIYTIQSCKTNNKMNLRIGNCRKSFVDVDL